MIPIAKYAGLMMNPVLSSGRLIFSVNGVIIGKPRPLSRSTSPRTYTIVTMESPVSTKGFEVSSQTSGTSKAKRWTALRRYSVNASTSRWQAPQRIEK